MKVIAFNGSPKKEGNTWLALKTVGSILEKNDIEVEYIQVGGHPLQSCIACNQCISNQDMKCVLQEDMLNEWVAKMVEADGILLGAPTYFAGIPGTMKLFLDRAFYVLSANKAPLRCKVGACVTTARRAGGIQVLDQLNHYITYSGMMLPGANYWPAAYGLLPGEALQDLEGMSVLSCLGTNMAWLLKIIDQGKGTVPRPEFVPKERMNFIRP